MGVEPTYLAVPDPKSKLSILNSFYLNNLMFSKIAFRILKSYTRNPQKRLRNKGWDLAQKFLFSPALDFLISPEFCVLISTVKQRFQIEFPVKNRKFGSTPRVARALPKVASQLAVAIDAQPQGVENVSDDSGNCSLLFQVRWIEMSFERVGVRQAV